MGTCFLSKNERSTFGPKLRRLGEIFYFVTKPHRLHQLPKFLIAFTTDLG